MYRYLIAAVVAISSIAFAQDPAPAAAPVNTDPPPAAAAIKQVMEYLEFGKDRGPALVDIVPCMKVDQTKGSPTLNTCIEPVNGKVNKGSTVFAWLQWYVPKEAKYDDVTIQVMHEAEIRQTIDVPLVGNAQAGGRQRGWRGANLSKVGKWTFKVRRGDKDLGSATVDVVSP
jgi:hypothetical protein